MQAAIEVLRRELRALDTILTNNKEEVASVTNGRRREVFDDTAAIHREAYEIQQAIDLLEGRKPSRD